MVRTAVSGGHHLRSIERTASQLPDRHRGTETRLAQSQRVLGQRAILADGLHFDGLLTHCLGYLPGLLFSVRCDLEGRHGSRLSLGIHRHQDVVRAGTEFASA